MRPTLPVPLLLLASALALGAPPVVGTPSPVDAPVIGPSRAGNGLGFARGVSGGGVGLVAWVDTRIPGGLRKVWATRVDAQGQPLDKPFLELGDAYGVSDTSMPRLAFDGTNFVVVWSDPAQLNVLFRRVSPAGVLLDAAPRAVVTLTTTGTVRAHNVVSNGAGLTLVTWVRVAGVNSSTLEGRRLDATGASLDATPLSISATPANLPAALVFDGSTFVALFLTGASNAYTLSARTISPLGALGTTTAFLSLGSNYATVAAACSSTGCLAAWPSSTSVLGARFSGTTLVDTSPLTLFSRASRPMQSPTLVFDGTRYWLTINATGPSAFDDTGVAVRLDPSGSALGSTDFADAFDPSGFLGPTGGFFALRGGRLLVTRIDATGAVLDTPPLQLDYSANDQREGRLAIAQGVALAAWRDSRESEDVVLARRFDLTGAPLDAQALRLGVMSSAGSRELTEVVFDGLNFVVGWRDLAGLHLSRVSTTGTSLDALGGVLVGPASAGQPHLVSDGQQTFVTWQQNLGATSNDVLLVRFSRAGVLLDTPPITVAGQALNEFAPSLCFDGTQPWIGWFSDRYRVSRLSAQGLPLDPAGLPVSGADTETELASAPACLAVWTDGQNFPRVSRLGPDGGIDGTSGSALGSGRAAFVPSVTWNGARALATAAPTATTGLALTRWENGQAIDPTPTSLTTTYRPGSIDSASNDTGTSLLLHQQFDSRPGLMAQRVYLTVVQDLANGQPCTSAAVCHSQLCVDGVCCDTACAGGTADCQACSRSAGAALDGTCGPATGNTCTDQNACTQADVCQAGTCVGMTPVSCPAPGECEAANTCAPSTGQCQAQRKPDGTACSLGACLAGACVAVPDAGAPDAGSGTGGGGGSATGGGGGSAAGGGSSASGGGGGATAGGGGGAATGGGAGGGGDSTGSGCGCTSGVEALAVMALGLLVRRRSRRPASRGPTRS